MQACAWWGKSCCQVVRGRRAKEECCGRMKRTTFPVLPGSLGESCQWRCHAVRVAGKLGLQVPASHAALQCAAVLGCHAKAGEKSSKVQVCVGNLKLGLAQSTNVSCPPPCFKRHKRQPQSPSKSCSVSLFLSKHHQSGRSQSQNRDTVWSHMPVHQVQPHHTTLA